jgi:adenosylcobinamide-phosphate synthase
MTEQLLSFIADGSVLVMWAALLFHFLLPIPLDYHPMVLWGKFAILLSDKVNKQQSPQQRLLSGSLSWLLMCIPALMVLIAALPLIWKIELYNLALLLLAIEWRGSEKLSTTLVNSLRVEDKAQARALLANYVNRETNTLSLLGLGKTGAETMILSYSRNIVAVLFWYAIGGGIAAIMYRLIAELARNWSPSRPLFRPFGLPSVYLLAALDFIPLRLFALLLCVGSNAKGSFHALSTQGKQWLLPGPGWLLASVGGKLEISLGGPAIYQQQKMIRPKVGGRIAPSAYHLAQLRTLLNNRIIIWVAIQSLIMIAIAQGL